MSAGTGVEPPAVDEHWVALIRGADRPGTLTAVTSVFSTRGVSFDSLLTGSVDQHDGDAHGSGLVAVTFTTTQRRQAQLMRTVARLAEVRDVRVARADDPRVRAAGVVLPGPDGALPQVDGVRWSAPTTPGGPVLADGTLEAVQRAIAAARALGATTTATVVLGL